MAARKRETVTVVSQEQLADGIFSMWIQTEAAKTARPGQFISMYTNDGSKLLPRPISICEIDTETSKLRVVYRVTAEKTGTEQFSKMKAGDTLPIIGPLGDVYKRQASLSLLNRGQCQTGEGSKKRGLAGHSRGVSASFYNDDRGYYRRSWELQDESAASRKKRCGSAESRTEGRYYGRDCYRSCTALRGGKK